MDEIVWRLKSILLKLTSNRNPSDTKFQFIMTVEEFKAKLLNDEFDDVLTNTLLSENAMHVNHIEQKYIRDKIATTYRVNPEDIHLVIVGSAKMGFSISEKWLKDGTFLPKYRKFRPDSDIDVAIISPRIFEAIWLELTNFSTAQPMFPWTSRKLGDYLVCGWLRPDYFPKSPNLRKCNIWWDTFRSISTQRKFGIRRVSGGLYYSFDQLKSYHARALRECVNEEMEKKI